jgi:hypothetical protein
MTQDRRSFDLASSAEAQSNFLTIATRIEEVISAREGQVKAAMSSYIADGVDEAYQGKEQVWTQQANHVRDVIRQLRGALEKNDETATNALSRAKSAVDNIAV